MTELTRIDIFNISIIAKVEALKNSAGTYLINKLCIYNSKSLEELQNCNFQQAHKSAKNFLTIDKLLKVFQITGDFEFVTEILTEFTAEFKKTSAYQLYWNAYKSLISRKVSEFIFTPLDAIDKDKFEKAITFFGEMQYATLFVFKLALLGMLRADVKEAVFKKTFEETIENESLDIVIYVDAADVWLTKAKALGQTDYQNVLNILRDNPRFMDALKKTLERSYPTALKIRNMLDDKGGLLTLLKQKISGIKIRTIWDHVFMAVCQVLLLVQNVMLFKESIDPLGILSSVTWGLQVPYFFGILSRSSLILESYQHGQRWWAFVLFVQGLWAAIKYKKHQDSKLYQLSVGCAVYGIVVIVVRSLKTKR